MDEVYTHVLTLKMI